MSTTPTRRAKSAAAGYSVYALMYLALAIMIINAGGWRLTISELDTRGATLLPLLSMSVLNWLLAFGSWWVLRFSLLGQTLLVSAAAAVAAIAVIGNIVDWWGLYEGTLPAVFGIEAVAAKALVAFGYACLAAMIFPLCIKRWRVGTHKSSG